MKKIVLLILLFCALSAMCFAQYNFELFGGMPLAWDNGKIIGYDATIQTMSISFGFGLKYDINDRISLCLYDEIIFPQTLEITVAGVKSNINRDAYDLLMGMSVLIGPVFNLYSNSQGKMKIPLTFGIRWMWLIASTEYAMVFGSNFGLGAGIGMQYNASKKIYIFGRVMLYYDFYAFSLTTVGSVSTSDSGIISSFGFTPNIGIGIKF